MKNLLKFKPMLLMMALTLVFTSCSDDDNDNPPIVPVQPNIVELALATPELSNLVAALQAADGNLIDVLSGDGPFTVLAPTNAAFTVFLTANGFGSLEDVPTDVLSQILLNHVISADLTAQDLQGLGAGYTSTNASGVGGNNISIYFNTENGVRFNSVSAVTTPDIAASNGTIHIVDAVIPIPSVVSHAAANPNFTSLVAALGASDIDLVALLSEEGPYTVLAPDNAAFTTFLDGAALGDVNPTALTQILLNHVLSKTVLSTDLTAAVAGYDLTNATGAEMNPMSIYFDTTDGVVFNGISEVTTADIVGSNGIIHAVDAVIDLPTIATFATANPALSGLVAAIVRADEGDNVINWLPAISDPNLLFTVFAPADPAFNVLLTDLGVETLADVDPAAVSGLLTLHVVNDANVRSTDLADLGGVIPTIGGNLSLDGLVITDGNDNPINILAPSLVDIQAINGVVHAVDYVIRAPVE